MSFWNRFFNDAGIPHAAAKSYATLFEENRITKDMLLDLNKEILSDIGIKVMGDVISILKHSKTVYNQELKNKEKLPAAAAPEPEVMSLLPETSTAVSTTMQTQRIKHHEAFNPADDGSITGDEEWTKVAIVDQPSSEAVGSLERHHPIVNTIPAFGTLQSDQMLLARRPSGSQHARVATAIEPRTPPYDEEYATLAFKDKQQRKRRMHADDIESPSSESSDGEVPSPKHTRTVAMDKDTSESSGTQKQSGILFSQRVLESAGLHSRSGLEASRVVQTSQSVFQRLGHSGRQVQLSSKSDKRRVGVTRDVTMETRSSQAPLGTKARVVVLKSDNGSRKSSIPHRESTMVADKVEQEKKVIVHSRMDHRRTGTKKGGREGNNSRGGVNSRGGGVFERLRR